MKSSRSGAVRLLQTGVWLLAMLVLGLEYGGSRLGRFLDGYARRAEQLDELLHRLGRALLRAIRRLGRLFLRLGRLALRILGPLGSLIRPVLRSLRRPALALLRALRRVWDWLNVWVLRRMFTPVGRFFVWSARRFPALMRALRRARDRALVLIGPALGRLDAMVAGVDRAVARLKAAVRRAWQPVTTQVSRWRRGRQHGAAASGPVQQVP